jgi:dipeptidyl aminopeptidase/acylaminoacyl peptidase
MLLKLSKRASCAALAVVAALLAPLAVQAAPDPVPIEAFFQPAKLRLPRLSPNGRWLAMLTSLPGRRVGLNMVDLEGREPSKFIEAARDADVAWFSWVSDDWLIFSVDDPDNRDDKPRARGLMTVKRDGTESRLLVHREYGFNDPIAMRKALEPSHWFIGYGAPGSNEIVLGEAKWDVRGEYSHTIPKLLNVATGGTRSLLKDGPRASDWLLDGQGRARAAGAQDGGNYVVYWTDGPDKPWRQISKAPIFEQPFTLAYVDDQGLMVHTLDGKGHAELRRFDFTTGKPSTEAILGTPGFDSTMTPVARRDGDKVDGVRLWVDGATTVWFNPGMQGIQAEADAALPGRLNVLSCQPCDDPRLVVVSSYSDRSAGEHLIYRPQQKKWQFIGPSRPDVDEKRMARLTLHRAQARDGLDLPVWVTQPSGDAKGPKPAVVLVHGGPWVRGNYWQWDADAQFLASRGYVVIEPEFRGSEGYSSKHFRAGWKQWGLAMQDDVTDALKFAVGQGWVDPSRVCIMGFSYGGYATLMGLVKDPDQYRCGIAGMAVSDPRNMFNMHWSDISDSSREFSLPKLMGDPVKDLAQFVATSPVEQAARIKAPVLLMHGYKDRRVPVENGEQMRDALKKNGKQVEWLLYPDEGHGFHRPENRIDFWRRAEAFLGKYLKPGEAR